MFFGALSLLPVNVNHLQLDFFDEKSIRRAKHEKIGFSVAVRHSKTAVLLLLFLHVTLDARKCFAL